MNETTRWWWVRHAPVACQAGRLYGQTDLSCDTSDKATLGALAGMLPADAVWVTSHLKRTTETARALAAAGIRAPAPLAEADLAEQRFGAWQGLTWDEIRDADGATHREFWRDPGRRAPPGGESLADVFARVAAVVERLIAGHAGRDIVAVTHSGSIRAALALALGLEPSQALALRIDNLSLTRIDHVPDRLSKGHASAWHVVAVNLAPR